MVPRLGQSKKVKAFKLSIKVEQKKAKGKDKITDVNISAR